MLHDVTVLNPDGFWQTWTTFVRGDIHRLRARDTRGNEEQGAPFAVIVQSDDRAVTSDDDAGTPPTRRRARRLTIPPEELA